MTTKTPIAPSRPSSLAEPLLIPVQPRFQQHDCIRLNDEDVDKWLEFYATSQDLRVATVICRKLTAMLKRIAIAHDRSTLKLALARAVAVATDEQVMWFDRVAAIQFIAVCADSSAIPALEAVFAKSKRAWGGGSDVTEAAAKALTALRPVDTRSGDH